MLQCHATPPDAWYQDITSAAWSLIVDQEYQGQLLEDSVAAAQDYAFMLTVACLALQAYVWCKYGQIQSEIHQEIVQV